MKHLIKHCMALVLLVCSAGEILGQQLVRVQREDQVMVPVLVYPHTTDRCLGVALVSPGAGGSENGYSYLAKHMSNLGYLTGVIGHPESGRQALRKNIKSEGLRDGLKALVTEPGNYEARLNDVSATKNYLQLQCSGKESILLGHSMGAAIVMLEAGAKNTLGLQGANAFDIYIALSPQGPGAIFTDNAWSNLQRPVLTITGTKDGVLGGGSWEARTEPFSNMPTGCKWLGVIENATHMNFAGRGLSRKAEHLTKDLIGLFIDSVHRGDCEPPEFKEGLTVSAK